MRYDVFHAPPPILKRLEIKGYKTFDGEDHDLNLIGVRSSNRTVGAFDDEFYCVYREEGLWIQEVYQSTCDPSASEYTDPAHEVGVAILKAGQYRGVWKLGKHRGKYKALCQLGAKVTFYRDSNKDDVSDHVNEASGYIGINGHRAHKSKLADNSKWWSAGCQVLRHPADFSRLITLCEMQVAAGWGDSFTYTLLEE